MDVTTTIQNIIGASKDFVLQKLGARERLISLARSLISSLERPSETIFRMAYAEPSNFALIRVAVDLKVFEKLKSAGGKPVTVLDISKSSDADPVFIHRALRHLAAMNVIKEAAVGEFVATTFSNSLTEDKFRGGIIYTYDCLGPSLRSLPEFLKETNYKSPTDPVGGPFQFSHQTKDPFFVWLSGHPEYLTSFSQYMGGYRYGKATWLDPGLYPVEMELKLDSTAEKDDGAVIVDIGGGKGQDLEELRTKHQAIKGRMILQDLPEVIEQIENLPAEIERVEHDFFTPQPVQGAKVYYLHSVLHDWDDDSCIRILRNISSAMRPHYSKILINDFVVPDKGATWPATAMDLGMMALGSVRERTEEDWRSLIAKAGLEIQKVTMIEAGSESIVEVSLPA